MNQQFHTWRSGDGERRWLSALINAMEEAARPEVREIPCESSILLALRAQLARPVSHCTHAASRFSLRN